MSEQAKSLNAEGDDLFKTGKYQDAISKYSSALKADPTVAAYHSNASACWEKLKEFSKMKDCARKCIEIDESFLKGHIQLVTALERLVNIEGFKKAVENGLRVDSSNADLLRMKNETEDGALHHCMLFRIVCSFVDSSYKYDVTYL